MNQLKSPRNIIQKQNLQRLAAWTIAWTLSCALTSFGHKMIWEGNKVFSLISIIVNLLIGIGMIYANRKLIEDADELEKKIQLESMGITLGLTLIVGIAYSFMDTTNLISGNAEISFLVIFMSLCYLTAVIINTKRYR